MRPGVGVTMSSGPPAEETAVSITALNGIGRRTQRAALPLLSATRHQAARRRAAI